MPTGALVDAALGGWLGDHHLEVAGRGEGLEDHLAVDDADRDGLGSELGGALLLDGRRSA